MIQTRALWLNWLYAHRRTALDRNGKLGMAPCFIRRHNEGVQAWLDSLGIAQCNPESVCTAGHERMLYIAHTLTGAHESRVHRDGARRRDHNL